MSAWVSNDTSLSMPIPIKLTVPVMLTFSWQIFKLTFERIGDKFDSCDTPETILSKVL